MYIQNIVKQNRFLLLLLYHILTWMCVININIYVNLGIFYTKKPCYIANVVFYDFIFSFSFKCNF